MEFKPTPEQESVIEAVSYNERVKIKAFAGAGKTSTLRLIAEHFSRKKILYLAFNASVSAESKGKFPPNVFVRTVNSLAYKYISATTDLSKLSPGLKAKTIGDEYAINDDYVCRAAISAFEAYCNSDVKILDRA